MAETEPATPIMDAQEDAEQAEAASNRGRMDSVYSTPPIGVQMSPEIPSTIAENEDASEEPVQREQTEEELALKGQVADLQSQLASLNSKLVKTFGRIGDLEDEVENANGITVGLRNKVNDLEVERVAWDRRLEGGLIVEKAHVQSEMKILMDRVIAETASRGKAEADKAKFEGELDELSASLFNEANRMVASERIAKVIAERKSESLEERLKDTEVLMGGQSEQMKELGNKLDSIERERDQLRNLLNSMEADPTVLAGRQATPTASFINGESIPAIASRPSSPGTTSQPFTLSHPMPTLMTDILPYHEFILYVRHLARLKTQLDQPSLPGQNPGYSRSEHLANILNLTSHTSQPFIKRCQEEDSDPCLRLDLAPGLNWLSRRNVSSAILEGQLIIEPSHHAPSTSCALCGTETLTASSRPGIDRVPSNQGAMRKLIGATSWGFRSPSPLPASNKASSSQQQQVYIFRIDNTTSPASFLLCSNYCLERLRTTCEFWGAVRGVARAVVVDGKKLSELKTGRGVPPAFHSDQEKSRPLEEQKRNVPPLPVKATADEADDNVVEGKEKGEVAFTADVKSGQEEQSEKQEEEKQEEQSAEEKSDEAIPEEKPVVEEKKAETMPAIPPPVPRRSVARPKIGTTLSSSNLSSQNQQDLAPTPTPSLSRQGSYMNLGQQDTRVWEIKTWDELVRIKEKLFWTRVGMQGNRGTV